MELEGCENLVGTGYELTGLFTFALRPQHCTPVGRGMNRDGRRRGYVAMKPSPGCRQHFDGDKRYQAERITILSVVEESDVEDVPDLYEEAMSTGCPPNADNSILLRWAVSQRRIDQVRALMCSDPAANPYACASKAILDAYKHGDYDIAAELDRTGWHIQRFWKRNPHIKRVVERAGHIAAACVATVATAVVLKEMFRVW